MRTKCSFWTRGSWWWSGQIAARLLMAILGSTAGVASAQSSGGGKPTDPGLAVQFSSKAAGAQPDTAVLPNVWLYVPAGQSPTPFLPAGPFTATWTGAVNLDIRAEYAFTVELRGGIKLVLNGETLIETNLLGGLSAPSKAIRLNKGGNAIAVTFTSPDEGDAFVRLNWIPKGGLPAPLPLTALAHDGSLGTIKAGRTLRRGRELFVEHRCARCHTTSAGDQAMPELAMEGPTFEGIGSRRRKDWMAEWIKDPTAQRGLARMPKLFHGPTAAADATAAAIYLATLKDPAVSTGGKELGADAQEAGKKLFTALHCTACHVTPGEGGNAEPGLIALKHVRRKFQDGALAGFIRKPEAHFEWIRMPNFRLTAEEADQLSSFLLANAEPLPEAAPRPDGAMLERGRTLVQTSGCLNCHAAPVKSDFTASPLSSLGAVKWEGGCLRAVEGEDIKAPFFAFNAEDAAALKAFGASDRTSLQRHVPAEFAERQSAMLNCRSCHGKFEGFPAYEILGGKLKPEWAGEFIAGAIPFKPRPWLESRMPGFAKRAKWLAEGLAMEHGYPPQTAPEPAIDPAAADIGRKLVSAEGGFSCISCHAIVKVGATQVFESAGINLGYTGARMMKPFYIRWIHNPLAIDPATKMPVYFDEEGKSPLTDVLDGSGDKQIDALWQYIRQGDKMAPPPGTEAAH